MAAETWIGMDVSKRSLDIVHLPEGQTWSVTNDAAGWTELCTRLAADVPTGIVMEATGSYHVGVMQALAHAGMPASVMNPHWIKMFLSSEGVRKKTDRSDAVLLARYGQRQQPGPTPLLTPAQQRLKVVLERRDDLVKMRTMEKNRQKVATDPMVQASIMAIIAVFTEQMAALEEEITQVIAADPDLRARRESVQSMPGVGMITSAWLLCTLTELGTLGSRELASLVGLAPHPRDSGSHRGRRYIHGGRPGMRKALYQAASTARQWNPVIRKRYRYLTEEKHKDHKVAVIACAHKMLTILAAMVRGNVMWTETKVLQAYQSEIECLT